jgi:rubrerythrin
MTLENSKTYENLKDAFIREVSAAVKYEFFAEQAKTDGYEEIYNVFNLFAENEKAHAKVWFKLFRGIGGTEENLKESADLEKFEKDKLYAEFSKTAKSEGFTDIATLFDNAGSVEGQHMERFKCLYEKVKGGQFFCSENGEGFKCGNCGFIYKGDSAPEKCPLCSHPKSFFSPIQN